MKRLILVIIFLGCFCSVDAQKVISTKRASDHSTYVKGNNFEGVIFDENYTMLLNNYIDPKYQRFTPTLADIKSVENILQKKLKETYKNDTNNYMRLSSQAIHSRLKKFCRQYFGYIDKSGKKIIHVNCFPKAYEADTKEWNSEIMMVLDGGTSCWRVEVNINDNNLFNLDFNGLG